MHVCPFPPPAFFLQENRTIIKDLKYIFFYTQIFDFYLPEGSWVSIDLITDPRLMLVGADSKNSKTNPVLILGGDSA